MELNKQQGNKDNENKKIRRNVLIVLFSIVLLIALIIGLLLFLHFRNIKEEESKTHYKVECNPTLLTDTTSLKGKTLELKVNTNDGKYETYVAFSTTLSNVSIGSYIDQDYLYSAYSANPNKVDISLKVKDKNSNNLINDISNLTFNLEIGQKDSHFSETLENVDNMSFVTYTSTIDIYIYSVSIEFDI